MTKEFKRKIAIIVIVMLYGYMPTIAKNIIRVIYPDTIATDIIKVEYKIEMNNLGQTVHLNNVDKELEILAGPFQNSFISKKLVDGKTSIEKSLSFSYIFSVNSVGIHTIPIAVIRDSLGNEISSASNLKFVVDRHFQKKINHKKSLIYIKTTVDKDEINLGDSIMCEVRLLTNMNITNVSTSNLNIDNAFWHKITPSQENTFETIAYKGDSIKSLLCAKYCIIPMQTGKNTINQNQFNVTFAVQRPHIDSSEILFDGQPVSTEQDTIMTPSPISINVKARNISQQSINQQPYINMNSDLNVVLDRSSSIYNREDSLKDSYFQLENIFLKQILDDKGLPQKHITLFAGKPCYITKDTLEKYKDSIIHREKDGSSIYDAIIAAIIRKGYNSIETSSLPIILITDGSDNSSRISAKTLINLLLQYKIRVDVVIFASKKDSVYYDFTDSVDFDEKENSNNIEHQYVSCKNNQDLKEIQEIAKATNGIFVRIEKASQIPEALREIKNSVLKKQYPIKRPNRIFIPNKIMRDMLFKEIWEDANREL